MASKKLQSKAEKLENKLEIKDRKWKMKTYKNCFVGKDAVSAIIELKLAKNIYKAIMFGQELMTAELIAHVANDRQFKNENLYYRFTKKYKKAKNKKEKKNNNNNDNEKKEDELKQNEVW